MKNTTFGRVTAGFLAVLVCGALVAPRAAVGSERWETLEAIHQLENPRNLSRPGPCGELGPYQFRETTWRMHTEAPFTMALERRSADEVAIRHYEWLKVRLERSGRPANPYNIALAWNAGLTAVLRGRVPASTHRYAERANNLAGEFGRSRIAQGR